MQILISREKLVERRDTHLTANGAAPQRLGGTSKELKRNGNRTDR